MGIPISAVIAVYKDDITSRREQGWTWDMVLDALLKSGVNLPESFNAISLRQACGRLGRYHMPQRELFDIVEALINIKAKPSQTTSPALSTARRISDELNASKAGISSSEVEDVKSIKRGFKDLDAEY